MLICSGRTHEIANMLNDRLISIPAGSEDDKNPIRKNHYEENIFKYEDQRYEIDMIIEILKFSIEVLNTANEKVITFNLTSINTEKEIGSSTLRFIAQFYKEYSGQVLETLHTHPKDTIPIIINRFKKRMEEAQNQKVDLEKNIKLSFDRFYFKSFDHRSFKFKNFDKKNNNAKAFIREITTRRKDKLITSNLNILKGGNENFEFFNSITFKYVIENTTKILKKFENEEILLRNIDLTDGAIKKKLPDMRMMFENIEVLKITITIIFYQIYFSNFSETQKVSETLSLLLDNLFNLNSANLICFLYDQKSLIINEKDLTYPEMIESIKSKNSDTTEIEKFYNFEGLTKQIVNSNPNIELIKNISPNNGTSGNNSLNKETTPDNHSEISLTPSLQSQDTGKTFKDMIIADNDNIVNNTQALFFPQKTKNYNLLFANDNYFVLIRYIYCIYERINKLYEYSISSEANYGTKPATNDLTILKYFVIVYKALIHKKIENTTNYEELCRDILGNESYYVFNLDKLINSVSWIFYLLICLAN